MLAQRNSKKIQTVAAGHGPLWQRDYRVVLEQSTLTPEAIAAMMRAEFPAFSPDELTKFTRPNGNSTPLEVGDEMQVEIRGAGTCEVRCIHVGPRSLTLRTLDGHMEAGRITFGAYRENGKLVIHIRSRARSGSRRRHVAYLLLGRNMQARLWNLFVAGVAARCGQKNADVETQTRRIQSTLADLGELDTPTFITDDR
jgi:hypothetical protein